MAPDKLRRLDDDGLRTLHRNCMLNLDHPARGADAAALLDDLHAEFTRRTMAASSGEFLPMLACVGYNVRGQGLDTKERRALLDWILKADLPRINDARFMASWGAPESKQRHDCLHDTILTYRRRYGSGPFMEIPAARWDADLAYVRERAKTLR